MAQASFCQGLYLRLISFVSAMSSKGTLKNFFEEKGFGFVSPDDGGDDCFVHIKENPDLEGAQGGESVFFDKEWDDRKGKYKGTNCSIAGGGGGGGKGGKGKSKGGDRYSSW